jgi:DNA-nicking Smr family endonuclease
MARKLGPDEQRLWGRVIDTVRPMHTMRAPISSSPIAKPVKIRVAPKANPVAAKPVPIKPAPKPIANLKTATLDGQWDRRIDKGGIVPDVTVDLHGSALSGAYARLDQALSFAIMQQLKVVLLITGKPRAHDRTSGTGRGAIAAVVHDWLSASRHASHITAVRNAHPRHGGAGALYIILKRG